MDASARIDRALRATLSRAAGPDAPPKLAAALTHVLFPGGARVRPLLTLAVASACGDDAPALSEAAAAALELMHCASLVHDDLPCFDDAAGPPRQADGARRSMASRSRVLAGDALIVLAFETLARPGAAQPQRLVALIRALGGRDGNAVRHLRRPGLGERARRAARPLSPGQDRRALRRRHHHGRRRGGRRPRPVAGARRAAGRGLPGGRRPSRHAADARRARQAGRPGRRARPAERRGGAGRRRGDGAARGPARRSGGRRYPPAPARLRCANSSPCRRAG